MGNKKKILTLCIIHRHPQVLLGMKKRGFGAGRWNGFGGKLHDGETIEQATFRELKEEAGVIPKEIRKIAVFDFEFIGNPEIMEVHLFQGLDIKEDPRESEEMRPQWFDVNQVPFDEMWPDDIHWFPLFLADKKFRAKFLFGESDKIMDMKITEVKEL